MTDNKLYAICWVGFFMTLCVGIVALTHYNLTKPNPSEIMERMVIEHGIHPLAITCMERDWHSAVNFAVCREVAKQLKISPEQEEKFKSLLDSDRSIQR